MRLLSCGEHTLVASTHSKPIVVVWDVAHGSFSLDPFARVWSGRPTPLFLSLTLYYLSFNSLSYGYIRNNLKHNLFHKNLIFVATCEHACCLSVTLLFATILLLLSNSLLTAWLCLFFLTTVLLLLLTPFLTPGVGNQHSIISI